MNPERKDEIKTIPLAPDSPLGHDCAFLFKPISTIPHSFSMDRWCALPQREGESDVVWLGHDNHIGSSLSNSGMVNGLVFHNHAFEVPSGSGFEADIPTPSLPHCDNISSEGGAGTPFAVGVNTDANADPRQLRRQAGYRDESQSLLLACPYYKLDPHRYRDCKRYILRRVKDIKQHIQRRHKRPKFYCDVCYSVFANGDDRDKHLRGGSPQCKPLARPPPDGISDGQRLDLKQYMSRGKSVQDQWYDMWAIVFPGKQPPRSVYVDSIREEPMCLARRVWSERKSGIISQALQDTLSYNATTLGDGTLDLIVHSFLDCVEAEMLGSKTTRADATPVQTSLATAPQHSWEVTACASSPEPRGCTLSWEYLGSRDYARWRDSLFWLPGTELPDHLRCASPDPMPGS